MAEPTNYKVFLELARRSDVGTGTMNRIALNALSVTISTNKTIPNVPVPLAGAITGESVNLAFDIGDSGQDDKCQWYFTRTTTEEN